MKKIYIHFLSIVLAISLCLSGCSKSNDISFGDSFSSGYFNTSDTIHCYRTLNGKTAILEYDSMNTGILCNRPNCVHNTTDCLVSRLGENVPMISGKYAFYFKDDAASIKESEDGKADLHLGTKLYRYDFSAYTEELLINIDNVSAASNCYGWLLNNNKIWFIGNWYRRNYDENGIITSSGNTGGRMELYSVDLSDMTVKNYGDLYNIEVIEEYYPEVVRSGEVYMKGIFDNKIYFQVAFVKLGEDQMPEYVLYVKYFDLETGEFVGDPTDYSIIDFNAVSYLSDEYLAVSSDKKMTVYKKGMSEPIVLTDDTFYMGARISIFDDMLFFFDKTYDLNTKECKLLPDRAETTVIAEYEDNYIISKEHGQGSFEKTAKPDYLAG